MTPSKRFTWWRYQIEIFSALLALWAENSPVTGEFSAQRPVTRSFDAFFDLRLNKRLSKQSCGWGIETPLRSLWRHSNGYFFSVNATARENQYTKCNIFPQLGKSTRVFIALNENYGIGKLEQGSWQDQSNAKTLRHPKRFWYLSRSLWYLGGPCPVSLNVIQIEWKIRFSVIPSVANQIDASLTHVITGKLSYSIMRPVL